MNDPDVGANDAKPARRGGRQRDRHADEAILAAAEALMASGGVRAVTMSAVITTSGVSRAAVYRRWPNRDELVVAVARRALGRPPLDPGSDMGENLRLAIDEWQEMFSARSLRLVLPAVIEGLLAEAGSAGKIVFDTLAPGRARLATAYDAGAEDAGLRSDVDGAFVADLLAGAAMMRLLATGTGPDDAWKRSMLEVVLHGLVVHPAST